MAEETVENICPTCHSGIIPYACLVLVSSSTFLFCGTFQLSKSTLDLRGVTDELILGHFRASGHVAGVQKQAAAALLRG